MKRSIVVAVSALALLSLSAQLPAFSKKWTIYQRQVKLLQEINAGQKSGELTLKEADALRNEYNKIKERIEKMKDKNAGKLSYEDQNKIEKELNKLSLRITKRELQKRVD